MSTDNPNFNIKKVVSIAATIPYSQTRAHNKHRISRRGTYTEANALSFQPVFDEIIASQYEAERIIPYATIPHNSHNTVYLKVCDALKWLSNSETGKELTPYTILKNNYRITKEVKENGAELGVGLRRKTHQIYTVTSEPITNAMMKADNKVTIAPTTIDNKSGAVVNDTPNSIPLSWKEQITEFVESGKSGVTFSIGLELIGPIERTWLEQYFSGIRQTFNIDYLIDEEKKVIKVLKE